MQFPQKAIYLHFALHKEVKIDLIKKKKNVNQKTIFTFALLILMCYSGDLRHILSKMHVFRGGGLKLENQFRLVSPYFVCRL